MNRLGEKLSEINREGKKAFITYMVPGLPDFNTTKEIIRAQVRGGVTAIELGVPFSDPVADGPIIQKASFEAIQRGVNLGGILQMVSELRQEGVMTPIILMMYFNTVIHRGIERFLKDCVESGIDGLIIPDLPLEEQGDMQNALDGLSGAVSLIQLVSPVSGHRLEAVLRNASGFAYCVSSMGVTGQEADFHSQLSSYLQEVKKASPVPIMLGFGVRSAADVKNVKAYIDGVIVGSAFIKYIEANDYQSDKIEDYVRQFVKELNEI